MNVHRNRLHPAFTIVELLVVISVISVLISIILPTMAASRESARRVVCLNNLRSLGLAIQMYQDDHDRALPYANYDYSLPFGWTEPIDALGPYLDVDLPSIDEHGDIISGQPFRCPTDPGECDQIGISYSYYPSMFMGVASPEWSEQAIAKDVTMRFYERGGSRWPVFRDLDWWHTGSPKSKYAANANALGGPNSLRYDGSVGWYVDDE